MEEIIIKISEGGKVNLNVNGIKGKSCKDLTKSLEKALGKTVEQKETDEYYEEQQEQKDQNFNEG